MDEDCDRYRSYLLRLWHEHTSHVAVWRASLESAQTGEQVYFASVEALVAFLLDQTANSQPFQSGSGMYDR